MQPDMVILVVVTALWYLKMYLLTLLEARQPSELVSQSLPLAVGGFFSL